MRHIAMFQKESRLAASVPLRGSASPRELLTRPLRDLSRLCANLPFFQTVVTKRRLNAASSYRSEEHTSELQSLMRISYAVFCLKKKTNNINEHDEDIDPDFTSQ